MHVSIQCPMYSLLHYLRRLGICCTPCRWSICYHRSNQPPPNSRRYQEALYPSRNSCSENEFFWERGFTSTDWKNPAGDEIELWRSIKPLADGRRLARRESPTSYSSTRSCGASWGATGARRKYRLHRRSPTAKMTQRPSTATGLARPKAS